MSGVMIKLGIYGLLRVSLDWLGIGPAWWGVSILLAGAASAVIGVLYALVDHDLKRLLAFHSIENIGIILVVSAPRYASAAPAWRASPSSASPPRSITRSTTPRSRRSCSWGRARSCA